MANVGMDVFPTSYDQVNSHAAKNHKHVGVLTTEEMFKNVDAETLHKLSTIYGPDYEIFGYQQPAWLRR